MPAEWNYHMPVVETWQGLHIAGRVLASLVNIYNSKKSILKLRFLYCIVMVCIGYTNGGGVRRRDADPPPPPPPAAPPLLLLLTLLSEPLMAGAPLVNKLHVIVALFFFAYLPFTKLVHMFSYPFGYIGRPFISMRRYVAIKK